ncbi:alpha/beta hydrolase [Actinoplanes sp. CA-142083]|uniref:alpha/beta hydrolase n=1 Tax=Actinoplanes sp. CA-142083 TaxID=3239903 RepID=UPI003D92014A
MTTRRTVLRGSAALAVATSGLAAPGRASAGGRTKANVLLVHGAWVDGSSWNAVIAILQRQGYTVVAAQLPMTSLTDDVAWTRHVLAERLQGPTVLAGHSYGGAVISGAATGVPNVVGLVYASAFAPDEGETIGGLNARFPAPPGLAFAQPDSLGFLWFDPAAIPANFAPDIPLADARVLAATQKPIAAQCFGEAAGPPAWKTLPSWALVSTQDRMINPDLERFMARRSHATTIEVRSSHASPASHPDKVAGLIIAAARAGR